MTTTTSELQTKGRAAKAADPLHFPDLSLSVVKLLGPGEYAFIEPGAEPEGHFGLAVHDYTHSTAPNRRFADLVTQRLLKAILASKPRPYAEAELVEIAEHCGRRGGIALAIGNVELGLIVVQPRAPVAKTAPIGCHGGRSAQPF